MTARHGGHLAAAALRAAGVDTVFTVPGGHVLHLLDGCRDEGLRIIGTRHEGAAALAAEGYALTTGRAGVAIVTAGPGFANALIGLLDAGVWGVPLVLIGGRTGLAKQGSGAVMDVDQAAVAGAVAEVVAATTPQDIPHAVREAVRRATHGAPRAVYLEIPMDLYGADAAADAGTVPELPAAPRPAPAPADLDRLAAMLGDAERPIAIAGTGARWSRAGPQLARFAERCQVPLVTTSAARGLVPDDHPWCLGSLVHAGAAVLSSDLVLVLGSAFDANLAFGRQPLFGPDQVVVQVDLDGAALGGNRTPQLGIVADVATFAAAAAERTAACDRSGWREQAATLAGHLRSAWDAQVDGYDGAGIHAGAVMRTVAQVATAAAGEAVTFVCDGGDALAWGLAYSTASGPGRVLTTTTALGTLGVGLPFALAAKAARPDDLVVLFTGDGSFGLSAMELDTCVRHDLPVVVVVSNNASWGDVAHEQDAWFGPGRRTASALRATRYDLLAQALGGHGEHVATAGQLRPALERAIAAGRTAVVDVETDPAVLSELLRNLADLDVM